jgi:hypothetical protein
MILSAFHRPLRAILAGAALTIVTAPIAHAQQGSRPAPEQKPQQSRAGQPARPSAPQAQPSQARPAQGQSNQARPAAQGAARPAAAAKPTPGGRAPAGPAAAPAAPATAPGGGSATLVEKFGDWGVYTAQTGRSKICYALSQPKDRLPKDLNRDPAYLFVSYRPAENVNNEVALVLGFSAREEAPAEAAIGSASFALLTKENSAWLKNPAEESRAITAMSRGQTITVKAQSRRGSQLTDRYSLNGFGPAVERARKECS